MSRIIPNQNTVVVFCPTVSKLNAPTKAELDAGVRLQSFVVSLNASTQGNTVPTPDISSLFETSVPGTSQASFTADFYRDDDADTAWESLPRGTEGVFVVSRFGGSGTTTNASGNTVVDVAVGDKVECWPVIVTSRSMANTASNTALTFTVTCAVPKEPNENATVAA